MAMSVSILHRLFQTVKQESQPVPSRSPNTLLHSPDPAPAPTQLTPAPALTPSLSCPQAAGPAGAKMQLLETEFSRTVPELIELHLLRQDSIPAFLSALTLELFSRQTLA